MMADYRYIRCTMLQVALALLLIPRHQTNSMVIASGATLQRLQGTYEFTEGPANDGQGNVYFTDQPNDRIMKWNIDGTVEEWMKPCGRSNGMAFDKKGNLITCADDKNELWSIAPDKTITVLIKTFKGKLMNGPNDVWIRPDGGMYITDPLYVRPYWHRPSKMQQTGQHVYFLSPDRKTMTQETDDLQVPNGIIGTPEGRFLYVGDLGLQKTFRYRIQPDGKLASKQLFCNLGSDGMTMDENGNVYLSGKGVTVFDKTGNQIEHIDIPEPWVGHVAFGGKDHHMLFITASKSIYGLQMKVRGAY
jgi:gluconolactonase